MASSFDRLSGLFARRKASAAASDTASTTPTTPLTESSIPDRTETHFPTPSFIRPNANRMQARDEILVSPKQAARRARSLPEARVPERNSSLKFSQKYRAHSLNSNSRRGTPQSSSRSSSIMSDARERKTLVFKLRRFMFPAPPMRGAVSDNMGVSQSPMAYTLPPTPASPRSRQGSPYGSPRSQTPTSFVDFEAKTAPSTWLNFAIDATRPGFQSRPKAMMSTLAPPMVIFTGHPPTPGRSPCITSTASRSSYGSNKAEQIDQKQGRRGALRSSTQTGFTSSSNPSPMSTRFSSRDSLTLPLELLASPLTEPDVDDFLALSDDDIAEVESPYAVVESLLDVPLRPGTTASAISVVSSTPSGSLRSAPLYTMPRPIPIPEPIRTHPAATAAAFEAAKIASKFKFDLVYVLNLWPEPRSSKRPDNRAKATLPTLTPQRGMTGRLLAAYGLSNIDTPLNISAAVHSKILQTAGWIEYRSQDAEPAEFARGYACAFYTGSFDQPAAASPDPMHCHQIDRGIVFAAYRKERADGAEVGSSAAELSELRRSAEGLVEMLIDMDAVERRRASLGRATFSDLTGPIPPHQLPTFF